MKDYYKVLGVEQDAPAETIKRIYRKLAKEHHPDLHPGDKKAEARFKEVSEAYGVLGDTQAKEEYDRLRFGAHPTYGVKARPVNTEIFVSQAMEKLYEGGHEEIQGHLLRNIPKLREEIEVSSKIIHVALFNLLNQGAADRKREQEVDKLKRRLESAWEDGQVAGYRDALEMFYQRNK